LWYVLVFFCIQTVLVVGIVLFRRERIRRSLDDALRVASEAMVENLLSSGVGWSVERMSPLVPKDAGFVCWAVRDEAQSAPLVAHPPGATDLPFSSWETIPAGPVGAVFRSIGRERAAEITGTAAPLRLITIPFRLKGDLFYFQAAVRDQVLDRLLGPFTDLVMIGVPVSILAAMIAAWVIAGRVVSPIDKLSQAARDVSPTRLGERFQVSNSNQEIARLESELNSALGRLEEGYQAQNQFISNVSHELKTPIAVLLTEIQVAKLGRPDPLRLEALVTKVEREMKRLASLVESFLMLARSDPGSRTSTERVSVHDLILECVQRCRLLADEQGVHLVPTLSESDDSEGESEFHELIGDTELLQTMVENLVRNAIGHSPLGAVVSITAGCTADEVGISVHDEGPGIPEEYLSRVFERFVQVPKRWDGASGTRGTGGLGIGLAIASNVAQLHGGRIRAINREKRGCTFEVWLPRKLPPQPTSG
jgi:signal transduction histidine kinase